jgi:hypothetical protein
MKFLLFYISFQFLGSTVEVKNEDAWQSLKLSQVSPQAVQGFYKQLVATSPDRSLVNSLIVLKEKYQMSDWVYYLLIRTTIDQLFFHCTPLEKDIILYTLLDESGYKTRAGIHGQRLNVYVAIDQEIYEQVITIIDGVSYVCLNRKDEDSVPGLMLNPKPGRRIFSFDLQWQSLWPAQWTLKHIQFEFEDSSYQFSLKVDQNIAEVLDEHPLIEERFYIQKALSKEIEASIRSFFLENTHGMSIEKAVKFALAFTRAGFEYREDELAYGRNRPMIAEELFVHRYSDCEDRAALFYQLNRLVFQLPIAVISFPEHVSIAISSDQIKADVAYKLQIGGKSYYHADPTGPEGWYKIGHIPGNLRPYMPEVLVLYEPD